jgi:diguanylate cyclase (GGDEF)-like protein
MITAALLFISGMRQFVGRHPWPTALLPLALCAYVGVGIVTVARQGFLGRHVLLNIALGLLYGWLAALSLRSTPHQPPGLRPPLRLLSALMGLLSALTVGRGLHVSVEGTAFLYSGRYAQVYYAYASLAAVLLALVLLWMVFVRLNLQLADLASRDALTRVLNRNGLDDVLTRHFGDRGAAPVTLLQLDLDHFKQVNDRHGHATGDALLRAVGEVLTTHVRPNDFVARTGGEEFLIGCVSGDAEHAAAFAERLRQAIAEVVLRSADGHSVVRCTASVGISQPFGAKAQWEQAAREADQALYAAKSAGRDRVVASLASAAGRAATSPRPAPT